MGNLHKIIVISLIIFTIVFLCGCQTSNKKENDLQEDVVEFAQALVEGTDGGYLNVTLVGVGDNYKSGYTDYNILVNNEFVLNLPETFVFGETFSIGKYDLEYITDGNSLSTGDYKVIIIVLNTIIYRGDVTID